MIMDYERKYKEALEKAGKIHNEHRAQPFDVMLKVFPELKESKNERIRKYIIGILEDLWQTCSGIEYDSTKIEEAIAWLEKQGKEDMIPLDKVIKFLDDQLVNDKDEVTGEHFINFQNYGTFKESFISYFKRKMLEKQGEQEPTNKVEYLIPQKGEYYVCIKDYCPVASNYSVNTKGKIYKSPRNGYINNDKGVGLSWTNSCTEAYFSPVKDEDWIVCENNNVIGEPIQYKTLKSNKVLQKAIKSLEDNNFVIKLRFWSINDAKDGDVLYAKGGYFKEYIFMFSSFTEDNVISTHFGYDVFHKTFDTKLSRFGRKEDFISVTPATKEQRDLLFQKMKEAGYEWDAEKRELKKIEQKPFDYTNVNIQQKDYALPPQSERKSLRQVLNDMKNDVDYFVNYAEKYVKEQEQKPQRMVSAEAKEALYDKPEWSEEDERIYQSIIDDTVQENQLDNRQINWIKSLKDRYTWKPSGEQMEALKSSTYCQDKQMSKVLFELYQDLKKLRED